MLPETVVSDLQVPPGWSDFDNGMRTREPELSTWVLPP